MMHDPTPSSSSSPPPPFAAPHFHTAFPSQCPSDNSPLSRPRPLRNMGDGSSPASTSGAVSPLLAHSSFGPSPSSRAEPLLPETDLDRKPRSRLNSARSSVSLGSKSKHVSSKNRASAFFGILKTRPSNQRLIGGSDPPEGLGLDMGAPDASSLHAPLQPNGQSTTARHKLSKPTSLRNLRNADTSRSIARHHEAPDLPQRFPFQGMSETSGSARSQSNSRTHTPVLGASASPAPRHFDSPTLPPITLPPTTTPSGEQGGPRAAPSHNLLYASPANNPATPLPSSSSELPMDRHQSSSSPVVDSPATSSSEAVAPPPSTGVSLREIRQAVKSKTEGFSPAHPSTLAIPSFGAGEQLLSSPRRPNAARSSMAPRAAANAPALNGSAGDEGEEDDDDDDDDELDSEAAAARHRARGRRMTLMDFLAAEPPPPSSAPPLPPLSTPSRRGSTRVGMSSSVSASSIQSRQRPKSMVAASPTHKTAGEGGRGVTVAEFLAQNPPPDLAPINAETVRSRKGKSIAVSHQKKAPSLGDPFVESVTEASSQERVELERARLEEQVTLSVKPMMDTVTMFGSTQTSANYSLSGSVLMSLPRPRRTRSQERRSERWETSSSTSSLPLQRRNADTAGDHAQHYQRGAYPGSGDGDAGPSTALLEAPMVVKSLSVVFAGYSIYADLSGRYSGVRLCEVTQDLLTSEATLPLQADLHPPHGGTAASSSTEPLQYEIQFDLNIPGWLPGSFLSRFGATFYCVGASAVVWDRTAQTTRVFTAGGFTDEPEILRSSSGSRDSVPQHPNSVLESPAAEEAGPSGVGKPVAFPSSLTSNTFPPARPSSSAGAGPSAQTHEFGSMGTMTSAVSRVPTVKQKHKSSWLSKRAKQLSLKSKSAASPGASGPGPATPGPAKVVKQLRKERGGKTRNADGSLLVRSDRQLVVVRRCRDVVPVPVARLAIVGDGLPEGSQDEPAARVPHAARGGESDTTPPQSAGAEPRAAMDGREEATSDHAESGPPQGEGPREADTAADNSGSQTDPPAASDGTPNRVSETAVTNGTARPVAPAAPARAAPLPPAPSALTAPTDPAKLAAALAQQPSAPVRTSSAANGGPEMSTTGSSSGESSSGPPMRHFLHRPILHPPMDSGIEEGEGLPFSLTISVPSHVQVQSAEVLTFGVQVEVGRTAGWSKVRELGGLRLRDMELICLQTERHTSVPSRTFCATFPLPTDPKIPAEKLPLLPQFTPPLNNRQMSSSHEARVRGGYDPEAILTHLFMAETGNLLPPEENDVERIRTNVVGPPPNFQQDKRDQEIGSSDRKGKSKEKDRRSRAAPTRGGGGEGSRQSLFCDETQGGPGSGPASVNRRGSITNSTSVSSRTRPGSVPVRPRQPDAGSEDASNPSTGPAGLGPVSEAMTAPSTGAPTSAAANAPAAEERGQAARDAAEGGPSPSSENAAQAPPSAAASHPPSSSPAQSPTNGRSPTDGIPSPTTPRRFGRGRRAYEATMRGLSAFATAMMDVAYEDMQSAPNAPDPLVDQEQPRASYTFTGDDGYGVDLTKGRIRMTVNLPMVAASATAARRASTPQLIPDYESPHMRIRHKLKVKLGFGFGTKPLGGEGDWGQALVMCVPVRFTEAPPKEVREQFAPMPITITTAAAGGPGIIQPTISVADANSNPVLPAYTQLFRDDGSRLNEAEDLPAYPGPRTGPVKPSMPHRGSVTGPMTPRAAASAGLAPAMEATASQSLAPEHVVDDAIQNMTDPDESMAAMREQEREMREMEEEDDRDEVAREEADEDGGRSPSEGGEGEGEGRALPVTQTQTQTHGTFVSLGPAASLGMGEGAHGHAPIPELEGEDTVLVGGADEGEEQIREREEELGL